MDHITCRHNPEFVDFYSCKLNFINRLTKSISAFAYIKKPLDDVNFNLKLFYKFRTGYKMFLADTTINLCDYLKNITGSKVLDILLPKFLPYLTSPTGTLSCPLYGGHNVTKMPISGETFNNMFIPVGDYMLNMSTTTAKNELIWNVNFYFTIPEGKTAEDDRMGR